MSEIGSRGALIRYKPAPGPGIRIHYHAINRGEGAMSTIRKVPLDKVHADVRVQTRVTIDHALVNEYAAAMVTGALFPHIDVFGAGGHYWIADGFHRYYAAIKCGQREMLVRVWDGTLRDAILFSLQANEEHGRRRTNADKHKAVMIMLEDEEWRTWSTNEISRRCLVSEDFVAKVRAEFEAAHLPKTDSEMGAEQISQIPSTLRADTSVPLPKERKYKTKHGTEAVMNTANIGKKRRKNPDVVPPPAEELVLEGSTPEQRFYDTMEAVLTIADTDFTIEDANEVVPTLVNGQLYAGVVEDVGKRLVETAKRLRQGAAS